MAKDFAKQFYKSRQWELARNAYIKEVGGLCEDCKARGIYKPGVIVHHIIPLTADNIRDLNVSLNPKNFRLVCRDCHAEAHPKSEKRYFFSEDGSLRYPPGSKKF